MPKSLSMDLRERVVDAMAGGAAAMTAAGIGTTTLVAGTAIAGAVGSIASQGFAIATGNQDKFSCSAVATAAIAAGVGGAFSKVSFSTNAIANGVARSLPSNAVTQGVSMAVGLQKKFDWTGLAVSGVVGGVVGGLQDTK